jgi:hypothetical protein
MWTGKRRKTLEKKNKQGERNMLQGADIVKFIKFLRLRWCGHVERIESQQMPKQIAALKMEGPRKRWSDVVEVNLNIMGIKKQSRTDQTFGNGERFY